MKTLKEEQSCQRNDPTVMEIQTEQYWGQENNLRLRAEIFPTAFKSQ